MRLFQIPFSHNCVKVRSIHFDIGGTNDRLVTQMYFPGEPLNEVDFLLRDTDNKQSLIAKAIDRLSGDEQAIAYSWTVVLGLA